MYIYLQNLNHNIVFIVTFSYLHPLFFVIAERFILENYLKVLKCKSTKNNIVVGELRTEYLIYLYAQYKKYITFFLYNSLTSISVTHIYLNYFFGSTKNITIHGLFIFLINEINTFFLAYIELYSGIFSQLIITIVWLKFTMYFTIK